MLLVPRDYLVLQTLTSKVQTLCEFLLKVVNVRITSGLLCECRICVLCEETFIVPYMIEL